MRLIRGDQEKEEVYIDGAEEVKVYLKRIIGYDPLDNMMIVEDPYSGKRYGIYMSTGAVLEIRDNKMLLIGTKHEESKDEEGRPKYKIVDYVKAVRKFIDPPPERPDSHSKGCRCQLCLPYREYEQATGQEVLPASGIPVRRTRVTPPNRDVVDQYTARSLDDYEDEIPF